MAILNVFKLVHTDEATAAGAQFKSDSYGAEAAFYTPPKRCPARRARRAGLALPDMFKVEVEPGAIPRWFGFLMSDLSETHSCHPSTLDLRLTKSALAWLATFHALFWGAPLLTSGSCSLDGSAQGRRGGLWHRGRRKKVHHPLWRCKGVDD